MGTQNVRGVLPVILWDYLGSSGEFSVGDKSFVVLILYSFRPTSLGEKRL
jgi:hypothetical protein